MNVVLLTARDPLQAADVAHPVRLARQLSGGGDDVVLVLVEDAVTLARAGHTWSDALAAAHAAGVRIVAEQEALSRRAVHRLVEGVKPISLGDTVDLLVDWSDRRAWL
ncbi:MAG: DsrE family protein [Actinobacteria bacterium]|nr:DsrE family protein [Actinomycetota bacterium]MDP9022831.1 DsrE family protein [Actinomycetota bacterium]